MKKDEVKLFINKRFLRITTKDERIYTLNNGFRFTEDQESITFKDRLGSLILRDITEITGIEERLGA